MNIPASSASIQDLRYNIHINIYIYIKMIYSISQNIQISSDILAFFRNFNIFRVTWFIFFSPPPKRHNFQMSLATKTPLWWINFMGTAFADPKSFFLLKSAALALLPPQAPLWWINFLGTAFADPKSFFLLKFIQLLLAQQLWQFWCPRPLSGE